MSNVFDNLNYFLCEKDGELTIVPCVGDRVPANSVGSLDSFSPDDWDYLTVVREPEMIETKIPDLDEDGNVQYVTGTEPILDQYGEPTGEVRHTSATLFLMHPDDTYMTELVASGNEVVTIVLDEEAKVIGDEKKARELRAVLLREMRETRDALMQESDYIFFNDYPIENLDPEYVQSLKDYRRALRDLPSTVTDPENIVWPVKP